MRKSGAGRVAGAAVSRGVSTSEGVSRSSGESVSPGESVSRSEGRTYTYSRSNWAGDPEVYRQLRRRRWQEALLNDLKRVLGEKDAEVAVDVAEGMREPGERVTLKVHLPFDRLSEAGRTAIRDWL